MAELEGILQKVKSDGRAVAAYISESMLSCGGQVIPPDGYFSDVYR